MTTPTTTDNNLSANTKTGKLDAMEFLNQRIDNACNRIAPLWPLKNFVAVNPFVGMSDMSFQKASDTIARIVGKGIYMPRKYYLQQVQAGNISRKDIKLAIERCGSKLELTEVEQILETKAPTPKLGMASVSEVLDRVEGGIWTSFVTERISTFCAGYFDLGQAMVKMPWRDDSLYTAWRKTAVIDRSPAMMGLTQFRADINNSPSDPRQAIAWAVKALGIREANMERYLHASLLSIGGWASWTRYLRWQAELQGKQDDSIVDLLAIRLVWDVLLYKAKTSGALIARWREMLAASMRPPSSKRKAAAEIDRIMLNAMEINFQRVVIYGLRDRAFLEADKATETERPSVQAAFCIDVRSEVFRRSLETVSQSVQTIGFAGFFGIFIEYVPFGSISGRSHVPVIFNPAYVISEKVKNTNQQQNDQQIKTLRRRIGLSKAWKGFKLSASSCFSFVEAAGLMYGPKLLSDGFGWTRPVPDPVTDGLDDKIINHISPTLESQTSTTNYTNVHITGIPEIDRLDHAERILRAMSTTDNFARLVLLAGHGSTTVNNPHATGLDCGACAGQTGEASARVVAALLNDRNVRQGLIERDIHIPQDTWFLAGLHDTTTDDVKLFDIDTVPADLSNDLQQLQEWLDQAGDLTRMHRAVQMGSSSLSDRSLERDMLKRSRDWSQVRPEWALANNAAFIAAPRERTLEINLEGRAFLHDYQWQQDDDFKILELIMTAPMVVANWINMQYYGSVVNNERFGSGNKVLHNIVGGAIGVLEGNGGDLRVGLPMQSLHNGDAWVHQPLRLSVFIEAPAEAIDNIISNHKTVKELVINGWLHLFHIDGECNIHHRKRTGGWHELDAYV